MKCLRFHKEEIHHTQTHTLIERVPAYLRCDLAPVMFSQREDGESVKETNSRLTKLPTSPLSQDMKHTHSLSLSQRNSAISHRANHKIHKHYTHSGYIVQARGFSHRCHFVNKLAGNLQGSGPIISH